MGNLSQSKMVLRHCCFIFHEVAMSKNVCGVRIRIARARKNLKQIDLAVALEDYKINLNQTAIGKMERGERNVLITNCQLCQKF